MVLKWGHAKRFLASIFRPLGYRLDPSGLKIEAKNWLVWPHFDYALAAGRQIPRSYIYGRSVMLLGILTEFCQNWTLSKKWYISVNV